MLSSISQRNRAAQIAAAVLLGLAAVSIAAVSTWLGHLRGDYKPVIMSVSILGERGSNHAGFFAAALILLGVALILAGVVVRAIRPGAPIALAGVLMIALALIPIDPASSGITLVHRGLTACALLSLVAALFTSGTSGWFALVTRIIKLLVVMGVVLSVGLLFDGFPGGVWERAMFALLLGWVELYLIYLIQASGRTSIARAAS